MAPLPAVPSTCRLLLDWDVGADLSVTSSFHWAYSGGAPAVADLNAIASAVFAAGSTAAWQNLHVVPTILTGARAIDLSVVGGPEGIAVGSSPGSNTGQALPASACAVLLFEISRRYRGGRPKIFLPWGSGAFLTSQQNWSGVFIGLANTAWENLTTALTGLTVASTMLTHQVSISYFAGFTVVTSPTTHRARNVATPRTSPLVDTVTAATCTARIGSQRRRL